MSAPQALKHAPPALARSPEPFPERPVFVFARGAVAWGELVPNLEPVYGRVPREVLGTFPVPGNFDGTDLGRVSWDNEGVRFAGPGEYYLHTTVGFFKLLILPERDDDRVMAIARFAARNSVHCQADARKMQPDFHDYTLTPDGPLRTLFAGDQPVKLHCGYLSMFVGHLLRKCGYRARLVQLHTAAEPPAGHIVTEAYLPGRGHFALIDADFGAAVRRADTGEWLSVAEAAALLPGDRALLDLEDIGNKHWLKSAYNSPEPTPDFAWTPRAAAERTTTHWPALTPGAYLEILELYTASYSVFDGPLGQGTPRRFRRDGAPHPAQGVR